MRGSIHKNGMEATSWVIWFVTANNITEAVALKAIHRVITPVFGRVTAAEFTVAGMVSVGIEPAFRLEKAAYAAREAKAI